MDAFDDQIVRTLIADARITNRELGQLVGLSTTAAGQRVRRLFADGVLTGVHATADHARLGRPIEASLDLWVDNPKDPSELYELVARDPRIVECFHTTGTFDVRIRARLESTADLRDLLVVLKREGGARQTESRLVLEQVPTRAD